MMEIIIDDRGQIDPVEIAIQTWLHAKSNRSGSAKTQTAYRDTLQSFRSALEGQRLHLYSDPRAVALVAQVWAGHSLRDKEVSPATYNQRLACVSSFYVYAKKQGMYDGENPISRVERRKVQSYGSAVPIDDLKGKLAAIDRSTLTGKRDYALLSIASTTGRRLSELAALTRGDLQFTDKGERIIVKWSRAKGGKVMNDKLTPAVTKALLEYLSAIHGGAFLSMDISAPIWLSTAPRNRGKALGIQSIADICQKYLGTSKVHALRHTFAHAMEQAGAPVSEIQSRLGHESLATTGRYLAALGSAENRHAEKLADMFGIE